MAGIIFVDVEAGANCPYSLQQVYSALDEPRPVQQVRLYYVVKEGALYDVVGWAQDGACAAFAVTVEDSGQGQAYLIYGGERGLRFRPASSAAPWSLTAEDQWGESHVLLADAADVAFSSPLQGEVGRGAERSLCPGSPGRVEGEGLDEPQPQEGGDARENEEGP